MHTECTVMHNSTSSSMHNNPSVGKKQMSESFSEFSIIIFVYFTRPSFHGLGLTMKMWTEAKGEEEGIGFIQVGVIQPDRPRTRELSFPVAQESNDAMMSIALLVLLVLAATASHLAVAAEVMVLDDGTFEHLTQASTGQTTGNWFVKFYAPCECCWLRSLLSFFVGLCWRYALATRSVTCIHLYA